MSLPLYPLFSGNGSKIPERKTSPCSTRVKQKILQHLLKCRGEAINVAKGIQVIFEGLFGGGETTNQKCKVASLQFAANLISYGQKDLIFKLSKVLQTYITKLIDASDPPEPVDVKNAAYYAIAKLVTVCPHQFNKDVSLIVDYFNYLNASTADLHNSIREVLVSLAHAFKWDPSNQKEEAMELDDDGKIEVKKFSEKFNPTSSHLLILGALQEQAESRLPIAQNTASFFLTNCFPSYYVPARYLLLVLCGSSPILRETIYNYLYGSQRKDHINYTKLISCDHVADDADEKVLLNDQTIILPGFKPLIHYIDTIAEKKLSGITAGSTHKLAFNLDVFTEILDYLRVCLWFSAGCSSEPGNDKDMCMLSDYIKNLNDNGNIEHVEKYLKLIRNVIVSKKGFTELSCLSDILTAAPEIVTLYNSEFRGILGGSLREVNESIRVLIAKIYGILIAYGCDESTFYDEMKNLLNSTQKPLEFQHGCFLALASGIFYRIVKFKKSHQDTTELKKFLSSNEMKSSILLFVKLLSDQKTLLIDAGLKGISMIGCATELPLEVSPEKNEADGMDIDDHVNTKNHVFNVVFQLLKSSQTKQKIREDSAHCLGHLSIGDRDFFAQRVIGAFLELKRSTKDAAIHIAIAQGLVFVVAGDETLPRVLIPAEHNDELLTSVLSDLVKIVPEVNVCSRQAVALWLLAVVKACSTRKPVLDKRRILQMAFTNLLSEDNELVQDVASRGLGLIYSMSSESDQSDLSNLLLEQLSEGNKGKVRKVDADTELFDEGVLGKAPQGGNLTTYKELCSLASDLNQPEIIYQFMQLANNNASWNSKLGAAFGLKSISGIAKVKVQPYLNKIVPKLYRYKYDPTPKIQNSMISIWDAVVIDNRETIELYYWEILEDCTTNLTHTEWRTRIACCLAIRDLIKRPNGLKMRSLEKSKTGESQMEIDGEVPEPELKKLWQQLFRVMDDYHEGTREAAEGTAKQLAKICVVASSSDHGKDGINVSSSILPFFLESGVTHTVAEIRRLSLKTVSEMIDSSGHLIKPHLSSLIPCLLKATGELDSSKLSYISNMVAGQEFQESVDTVRAEAAKSHYTMETLIKCIKYIDFEILEKTTPSVLDLIKSSVIMGTKVATAHFVCLISVHLARDMTSLVGKYLSACIIALSDRNTVVRKYYASAIGHLIGCAKDTTVVSLFKKLNTLYFDDPSGKARVIVLTLNAINKKHADIIRDYANAILPLIFFAKHEEVNEENKSSVEMWNDLWNDVSFGDSMLHLYFNDILAVLESQLSSQSWLMKAQSGNSIKTIAKRLETSLKEEYRLRLLELILTNVSGRTFIGKERLVEALAALVTKNLSSEMKTRVIDAVLKECRKEEEVYKTKVLKCLGDVLETLDEENRFEDVYNIVWDLLDKNSISSKDDEPGPSSGSGTSNEERNKEKNTLINLKEVVCETLGKSWPSLKANNSLETQEKYQIMLIVKLTECLKVNTRQIQKSLMISLCQYLEKLHLLNSDTPKSENLAKVCELVMVNVAEASGKFKLQTFFFHLLTFLSFFKLLQQLFHILD